jgi:hypothetical protein
VRSRLLLIASLLTAPITLQLAIPAAAEAAPKDSKKKKAPAAKSKSSAKESKAAPVKEPERVEPARPQEPAVGLPAELRGPTRIDFDDRLIQGQTNKSGAVYLFDRKETGISSMVRRRKSFRQLTLSTIYDR